MAEADSEDLPAAAPTPATQPLRRSVSFSVSATPLRYYFCLWKYAHALWRRRRVVSEVLVRSASLSPQSLSPVAAAAYQQAHYHHHQQQQEQQPQQEQLRQQERLQELQQQHVRLQQRQEQEQQQLGQERKRRQQQQHEQRMQQQQLLQLQRVQQQHLRLLQAHDSQRESGAMGRQTATGLCVTATGPVPPRAGTPATPSHPSTPSRSSPQQQRQQRQAQSIQRVAAASALASVRSSPGVSSACTSPAISRCSSRSTSPRPSITQLSSTALSTSMEYSGGLASAERHRGEVADRHSHLRQETAERRARLKATRDRVMREEEADAASAQQARKDEELARKERWRANREAERARMRQRALERTMVKASRVIHSLQQQVRTKRDLLHATLYVQCCTRRWLAYRAARRERSAQVQRSMDATMAAWRAKNVAQHQLMNGAWNVAASHR